MTKLNNKIAIGFFFSVIILLFNNCAFEGSVGPDVNATLGNDNQVQDQNPIPIDDPARPVCTTQQLEKLNSDLSIALQAAVTDADFSLKLESEDGRVYTFNRGTSTLDTVYESASTSKWVSASIVLSYIGSETNLSAAHPLLLDSKPQDFISGTDWPMPVDDTLYNITLRDLLSFTSGLKSDPKCINPGLPASSTMATCVRDIANANKGNGAIPAAEYFYSSSHLQVAGLMAVRAREQAMGTASSWQDLFADFKIKTGLFSTSAYDLPTLKNPRLAGGMHWTGNEYHQFIRSYYYDQIFGTVIIPGQTKTLRALQLSNQVGAATIASSPASDGLNEDWRYGFGLWSECHSLTFNCTSIDSYSSPGAYGAYPFMNLKDKYFGILARQGELGTFTNGYALFTFVEPIITKWAIKDCQ